MLIVLRNRAYRRLFTAQVLALLGTGLATVALGLLAYRLGGERAGAVLGTALAIKMCAYVLLAPMVTALAARLPRRAFLVSTDLLRAVVALALPWVDAVWQVYALIVVLQAASAAFTPTFQATIPTILPGEQDYTRALSLSRLAYELESLLSPVLAAVLLTVLSPGQLFLGTALGFLASALLVLGVALPGPVAEPGGAFERARRGLRVYLATPRLRALLALNLAAAAAGAMVLVNTVVLVRGELGMPDSAVALALAAYGAGSILAAVLIPLLLNRFSDRALMITGAAGLAGVLLATGLALALLDRDAWWAVLLMSWPALGFGGAAVQTPAGRLLRRSGQAADWPMLFAAQFTASHAAWLAAYLLAGLLGAVAGLPATLGALAALAGGGALLACRLWPPGARSFTRGPGRPAGERVR
ncbi:MFS transporter [Crossiella sp. SN42]|uniref:MFS transporter n=1 Tax=Crossiella sp. SN42 TaxID=2944808 RepID=UPI00207C2CD8|nr:MFS transporter [Crossiella sp. SN42]MCO1575760.1 MFS transporter [Crossiella sp. SN42]